MYDSDRNQSIAKNELLCKKRSKRQYIPNLNSKKCDETTAQYWLLRNILCSILATQSIRTDPHGHRSLGVSLRTY